MSMLNFNPGTVSVGRSQTSHDSKQKLDSKFRLGFDIVPPVRPALVKQQITRLKACLLQSTVVLQLRVHGDRWQLVGYIAVADTNAVVVGMN